MGHGGVGRLLAAYYCIGQAKGDPRLYSLLEHAHGTIYNRMMNNPDDGLAVPVRPRAAPPAGLSGPAPDYEPLIP